MVVHQRYLMSALPPKADINAHRLECPLCANRRHSLPISSGPVSLASRWREGFAASLFVCRCDMQNVTHITLFLFLPRLLNLFARHRD